MPSHPGGKFVAVYVRWNAALFDQLELTPHVEVRLKDVSPAGEANLTEGDVISEVKGQKVTSVSQFRGIVDALKSGDYVRMYVTTSNRGGRAFTSYRILQVP